MKSIDMDMGGECHRELNIWALSDIHKAQQEGIIDMETARQLRETVLKFQGSVGVMYVAADLPVPFFYLHLISLLTALYLPLFAVSAALKAGAGERTHWTIDVISGLMVMLQAIFIIGLRVLGENMSDPYGDDLIDLSVITYVEFTWKQSQRQLNSQMPDHEADWQEEHDIMYSRTNTIGAAWEPGMKGQNVDAEKPEQSKASGMSSMDKTHSDPLEQGSSTDVSLGDSSSMAASPTAKVTTYTQTRVITTTNSNETEGTSGSMTPPADNKEVSTPSSVSDSPPVKVVVKTNAKPDFFL
jgi:Bestrophin, RFP-TM, chloride channel